MLKNSKLPKIMSRKRRKLLYIRLKNRCFERTNNLAISWHTDQKSFQFGSATVRIPSRFKQQCFTLTIMTQEFEQQNKIRKATRLLQLNRSEISVSLARLSKNLKIIENGSLSPASIIDIRFTLSGLSAHIVTSYKELTIEVIEEVIESCYPILYRELKKIKFSQLK